MAIESERGAVPIRWLNEEEARALFDQQAHALLGISGDEFLRRWDAGEYRGIEDDIEHDEVHHMATLMSLVGRVW